MSVADDILGGISIKLNGATDPGTGAEGVSLEDFYAYMPMHNYIFAPAREMWPSASVNARIPPIPVTDASGYPVMGAKGEPMMQPASQWLDEHRAVEQMTWWPGMPEIIEGKLIHEGGWVERKGVHVFNQYRAPTLPPGDASKAGMWLNHIRNIYPDDASHIVAWLAHRVQHPGDKVNHGLVLGGKQGIGKDTMLEPVKRTIGSWNFREASPQQIDGRFNGFLKAVILRTNEARDLGDLDRFKFYDLMKVYLAAPPDVLRVDEKHIREYSVLNCVGIVITTNHKADGIFLPADDRRHYVAWSTREKEDFTAEYWKKLWKWYDDGGDRHVAAYLAQPERLVGFDPKAPPPKTPAFWEIVDASRVQEDAEIADAIDKIRDPKTNKIGDPDTVTIMQIAENCECDLRDWLWDRRNSRKVPHRLEQCGYIAVRNPSAKDGMWKVKDRRTIVYAKASLTPQQRYDRASAWVEAEVNAWRAQNAAKHSRPLF